MGSPGNDAKAKFQAAISSKSSVAFDMLQAKVKDMSRYESHYVKRALTNPPSLRSEVLCREHALQHA